MSSLLSKATSNQFSKRKHGHVTNALHELTFGKNEVNVHFRKATPGHGSEITLRYGDTPRDYERFKNNLSTGIIFDGKVEMLKWIDLIFNTRSMNSIYCCETLSNNEYMFCFFDYVLCARLDILIKTN